MIATWVKWDFDILICDMQFLCFLEGKMVNLGPVDLRLGLPLIIITNITGKTNFKSISQKM